MFEEKPKIKSESKNEELGSSGDREQRNKEVFNEKVRLIGQIKEIKHMVEQEELFSEKRIPYEALIESIQKRLLGLEAETKKLNSGNG